MIDNGTETLEEANLKQLTKNKEMLCAVGRAYGEGMPVLAECGGFMYLHREIKDRSGNSYPMVGAIDGKCEYTGRLVRFGYIELREKKSRFMPENGMIRGRFMGFTHLYYPSNPDFVAGLRKMLTGSEVT